MNNNGFIFVNLLPYREKQKKLKIKKFSAMMIAFGLVGAMFITIGHVLISLQIEGQEGRNQYIEKENKNLDDGIKAINGLKEQIKLTLEKRKIVETLQTDRSDAVNVVNELANNLPDDMSLKSIKKVGEQLTIVGQTGSNNKVSHYMTSLEESEVFEHPVLVEIKAVLLVKQGEKGKVKEEIPVSDFTITVNMQKSEEENKKDAEEKTKALAKAKAKK
jgi:type IV pilus assembly protein PilN